MKYVPLSKLFVEACAGLTTLGIKGNNVRLISAKTKKKTHGSKIDDSERSKCAQIEPLIKCLIVDEPEMIDLITQSMWLWMHCSNTEKLTLDQAIHLINSSDDTLVCTGSDTKQKAPANLLDSTNLKACMLQVSNDELYATSDSYSDIHDAGSATTLNRPAFKMFQYLCIEQIAFCSLNKDSRIACILNIYGKQYVSMLPLAKSDEQVYKMKADIKEALLFHYDPQYKDIELGFYEVKYSNTKNITIPDPSTDCPIFHPCNSGSSKEEALGTIYFIWKTLENGPKFKSINHIATVRLNPAYKSNAKTLIVLPINSIKRGGKTLGRSLFWTGLCVTKLDDSALLSSYKSSDLLSYRDSPSPHHRSFSFSKVHSVLEDLLTFFIFKKDIPASRMVASCKLTAHELLIYNHPPDSSRPMGLIPLSWIVKTKPNDGDIVYEPLSFIIVTRIKNLDTLDYPTRGAPVPLSLLTKVSDEEENYCLLVSAGVSSVYNTWINALNPQCQDKSKEHNLAGNSESKISSTRG